MSEWELDQNGDNDSGHEMIKDIPVENVGELIGAGGLNLR